MQDGKTTMFYPKIHEQTILEISQGDCVSATAESFLIDRQARELSRHTRKFYREFLRTFIEYCNPNSLIFIQQITPDFLRRYFLAFGEKHNPEVSTEPTLLYAHFSNN